MPKPSGTRLEYRTFPLQEFLDKHKAEGRMVLDHGLHCAGDPPGEGDRRVDHMLEGTLERIARILRKEARVPEFIIEIVIEMIRMDFQAQILHLRRSLKWADAMSLSWSDPERLAREPEMLKAFREFMEAGSDEASADEVIQRILARYPSRPVLVRKK